LKLAPKEAFLGGLAFAVSVWIGLVTAAFISGYRSGGNFGPWGTAILVGTIAIPGTAVSGFVFGAGVVLAGCLRAPGQVTPLRAGLVGLLAVASAAGLLEFGALRELPSDPARFRALAAASVFLLGGLAKALFPRGGQGGNSSGLTSDF
jgi:hypothetical protein